MQVSRRAGIYFVALVQTAVLVCSLVGRNLCTRFAAVRATCTYEYVHVSYHRPQQSWKVHRMIGWFFPASYYTWYSSTLQNTAAAGLFLVLWLLSLKTNTTEATVPGTTAVQSRMIQ